MIASLQYLAALECTMFCCFEAKERTVYFHICFRSSLKFHIRNARAARNTASRYASAKEINDLSQELAPSVEKGSRLGAACSSFLYKLRSPTDDLRCKVMRHMLDPTEPHFEPQFTSSRPEFHIMVQHRR